MNKVYLLKDIHFSNNYAPVVDFETKELQLGYFNKRKVLKYANGDDIPTTCNVIKNENLIQLPISVIEVRKYNYLMMEREDRFGNTITQYYFILSANYIEENVSNVEIELDIFQTHMWDYEIKESFIEREHQDRFIKDGNTFKPIYSTIKEELQTSEDKVASLVTEFKPYSEVFYTKKRSIGFVMVYTTEDIIDKIGEVSHDGYDETYATLDIEGNQTNLFCYLLPISFGEDKEPVFTYYKTDDDNKTTRHVLYSMTNYKSHTYGTFNAKLQVYLEQIRKLFALNQIISVKYHHYMPYPFPRFVSKGLNADYDRNELELRTNISPNDSVNYDYEVITGSGDNSMAIIKLISIKTSKITLPTNLSLPTFNSYNLGDIASIDNEPKLKTYPYSYNLITNRSSDNLILKNEYMNSDKLIIEQSFDIYSTVNLTTENYLGDKGMYLNDNKNSNDMDFHYVNDHYINFLLQNKAQLEQQTGMGIAQIMSGLALSIGGVIMGSTGIGLPVGLGAVAGGVGTVLSGVNAVTGVGSKIADARDTSDNAKKGTNNTIFNLNNDRMNYKQIKIEPIPMVKEMLYEFFQHYGYSCLTFKIPNLKSRYYYNYIKMTECNINTTLPISYKNVLIKIYTDGTTIFHCREDNKEPNINDYSLENVEMSLL